MSKNQTVSTTGLPKLSSLFVVQNGRKIAWIGFHSCSLYTNTPKYRWISSDHWGSTEAWLVEFLHDFCFGLTMSSESWHFWFKKNVFEIGSSDEKKAIVGFLPYTTHNSFRFSRAHHCLINWQRQGQNIFQPLLLLHTSWITLEQPK